MRWFEHTRYLRPVRPAWVAAALVTSAVACGGGGGADKDAEPPNDATTEDDSGEQGGAPEIVDDMTLVQRGQGLAATRDLAWLPDGRLGLCHARGLSVVEPSASSAIQIQWPSGCERISSSAGQVLAVDESGQVLELQGEVLAPLTGEAPAETRMRAALATPAGVFAAGGRAGLLRWTGSAWQALGNGGAQAETVDLAWVQRGAEEGLLVATSDGIEWWTNLETSATRASFLDSDGGVWRISTIDNGIHTGPHFAAAPRGLLALSESGPLTAPNPIPVRIRPVDVAPLHSCALAAGWATLTRAGCGSAKGKGSAEEFAAPTSDPNPVDQIGAVAVNEDGAVAVGTRTGWAVLDIDETPSEAPDIYVPDRSILLGPLEPWEEQGIAGFRIANDGDVPLVVQSVAIEDPRFEVRIDPFFAGDLDAYDPRPALVVEPFSAPGFLEVYFNPNSTEDTAEINTNMVIASNDPDEGILRVPIVANRRNPAAQDIAPEFALPSADGARVELASFPDRVLYFKLFNST